MVPTDSPRVGLEMEWLVYTAGDPTAPVPHDLVRQILGSAGPLPAGGAITYEPGGQVELSTLVRGSVDRATAAAATDRSHIAGLLSASGIEMVSVGVDPLRRNERVIHTPRYDRMEECFDSFGPLGRRMMRDTAALQINIDVSSRRVEQFRIAHLVGPVMSAIFADSPIIDGKPNAVASNRLAIWQGMDPSRTAPLEISDDPVSVWARYALNAQVILIGPHGERFGHAGRNFTFKNWIQHGHETGFPTPDDLDYHLTTLFPPIRPKAWLEIRMIDALPEPYWRAAVTAWVVLLHDVEAGERAERATAATANMWKDAAVDGLADTAIAESAITCMQAALDGAQRMDVGATDLAALAEFADRFTFRSRMPADERLEAFEKTGRYLPFESSVGAPAWI
ncbi:MAG: glutamate-cysteine ligase family protein [Actinomycetota bacterium]|nr:ergothioneine biosynthesis glutamate--cysteine ligase EgtA [Actinomycetota bacterium]